MASTLRAERGECVASCRVASRMARRVRCFFRLRRDAAGGEPARAGAARRLGPLPARLGDRIDAPDGSEWAAGTLVLAIALLLPFRLDEREHARIRAELDRRQSGTS